MTDPLPLVDRVVLDGLRASVQGDEAFVRDLVETFVGEATEHLDALVGAADRGDAASAVRPAHTLKSSGAVVGAMRLSDMCRTIEVASREGRVDELVERASLARDTWQETLAAFREQGLAT